MATDNGNGLRRVFGGTTGPIVSAILIAAITALVTLWRDVSVIQRRQEVTLAENAAQHTLNQQFAVEQERLRTVVGVLERFKGSYDKKEAFTDEALSRHFQYIVDLQQAVKGLNDHVTLMEQRLQRLEHPK